MFEVENISNNPLRLSDEQLLAPVGNKNSIAKIPSLGDSEKRYESLGWLTVNKIAEAESGNAPATPAKKTEEKPK